jgi:hypothetical protein
MHDDPTQRYSAAACAALFVRLFPHGGAGQDILTDIAPAGWAYSPLLAIFHPSLEQVYQEAVQLQRNMQLLAHYLPHRPLAPAPTFQEIAATFQPTPIDTVSEVRELVGTCLWDIFSHNHAVIGPEGRLVDIGSFRGASRFIATWLNRQTSENTVASKPVTIAGVIQLPRTTSMRSHLHLRLCARRSLPGTLPTWRGRQLRSRRIETSMGSGQKAGHP